MGYCKVIEPVFKFAEEPIMYGIHVVKGDYSDDFKLYYGDKHQFIVSSSFHDAEQYLWSQIHALEEKCKQANVETEQVDGWIKDGNGYWARISLIERPEHFKKVKKDFVYIRIQRVKTLEPVTYRETGELHYYVEPEERHI